MALSVDRDSPPVLLRLALADQRRRGRTFEQAWPIGVSRALAGQGGAAIFWRQAWSTQKDVWRASYDREPRPAIRLCDVRPIDESPSTRADVTLVA